ncbi:6308_t:CDS:2, partial [Entrophospora sp. SA101]
MATSNSTITIDDGDDNSANTSSNKKRKFEVSKGRPKDSFVWSYIEDHGDYRICKIKVNVSSENPDGLCNKKIKNNNSTKLKKQTDIRDFSKQKTIAKKEKDNINKKLLEFIIDDVQPFYILKSNSFQSFVQSLNPSYNLPTQEKIDEML